MLHAERVAEAIGRPITTEVILRFWKSDLPHEQMSKIFETKIRGRKFAYWSRPIRKGQRIDANGPPTFVWVAENKADHPHIHWCLYIAEGYEDSFEKYLRKAIAAVPELAAVPFEELITIRRIWSFYGYKMYLSKGLDPRYATAWKVKRAHYQGPIVGKRCGVSANLTRAARKELGL